MFKKSLKGKKKNNITDLNELCLCVAFAFLKRFKTFKGRIIEFLLMLFLYARYVYFNKIMSNKVTFAFPSLIQAEIGFFGMKIDFSLTGQMGNQSRS